MSLALRILRDVKISNQILKNLISINKGGRNYVISNYFNLEYVSLRNKMEGEGNEI